MVSVKVLKQFEVLMRFISAFIFATVTFQSALADDCPDVVSTAHGSFNLRALINQYGDRALDKAREGLDGSRIQDCDTVVNSLECHAAIELSAKAVQTLLDCTAPQSPNEDNARTPARTTNKNTKQKAAQDASKDSATNPWAQENKENSDSEVKNVETLGCPYLIQNIPSAYHRPNVYVCINGGTKKCEIAGKNSRQSIIYEWKDVSDSSCIHGVGWIDINAVELNAANSKKSTKTLRQD